MTTVNVAGYKRTVQKKKVKTQVCTDAQAAIDAKLDKRAGKKGFETLDRKTLAAIAKKNDVKTFQRKNADIIKDLREKAKDKKE